MSSILIYDDNAVPIKEIPSPNGHMVVSLRNTAGDMMVVAQGTSDLTRDPFERNDWLFEIDFEKLCVMRKSITQ